MEKTYGPNTDDQRLLSGRFPELRDGILEQALGSEDAKLPQRNIVLFAKVLRNIQKQRCDFIKEIDMGW